VHKGSILLTHFVELVMPWGVFAPGLVGYLAGASMIIFQALLILSGNLSWLNYITLILCIPCFDDRILSRLIPLKPPEVLAVSGVREGILIALAIFIVILSIAPTLNLFSPRQIMNTSFEPFHIVNTYGAFGSVTRTRNEIVLEGTEENEVSPFTHWREYEFKGKPGSVNRRPCIVSPYHYKLDWQMWFAAMSDFRFHPWILNLVAKLLQGDRDSVSLLAGNPFPKAPPKYVRARLYEYHFTDPEEKKKTGHWWKRTFVGEYLPPLSLEDPAFRQILKQQGWLS
jgi:hypothetical protein